VDLLITCLAVLHIGKWSPHPLNRYGRTGWVRTKWLLTLDGSTNGGHGHYRSPMDEHLLYVGKILMTNPLLFAVVVIPFYIGSIIPLIEMYF